MDIIVNGANGRMGRILTAMIEAEDGMRLAARVDQSAAPESGCLSSLFDYDGPADVLIDFSNHAATGAVMDYCAARALPAVIATSLAYSAAFGSFGRQKPLPFTSFQISKRLTRPL